MTYDTREALGILKRLSDRLQPAKNLAARADATRELREAVQTVAAEAGLLVAQRGSYCDISFGEKHVFLRLDNDVSGVSCESDSDPAKWQMLPIEFDPVTGMFVGTEDDAYCHPAPGQPKARRSAVACVAEAVTRIIEPQAAKSAAQ